MWASNQSYLDFMLHWCCVEEFGALRWWLLFLFVS